MAALDHLYTPGPNWGLSVDWSRQQVRSGTLKFSKAQLTSLQVPVCPRTQQPHGLSWGKESVRWSPTMWQHHWEGAAILSAQAGKETC